MGFPYSIPVSPAYMALSFTVACDVLPAGTPGRAPTPVQGYVVFRANSSSVEYLNPEWEVEFKSDDGLQFMARLDSFSFPDLKRNSFRSIRRFVRDIASARELEFHVKENTPTWFLTINLEETLETKWVFQLKNVEAELAHWRTRCERTEQRLAQLYEAAGRMYLVTVRYDTEERCFDGIGPNNTAFKVPSVKSWKSRKDELPVLIEEAVRELNKLSPITYQPVSVWYQTKAYWEGQCGYTVFDGPIRIWVTPGSKFMCHKSPCSDGLKLGQQGEIFVKQSLLEADGRLSVVTFTRAHPSSFSNPMEYGYFEATFTSGPLDLK